MHNVLAKQEDDNKNCDGKTNQNRKQKEIACMVGGVCDHAGSRHAEARSSGSTRQLLADSSRGTVPDTILCPVGRPPAMACKHVHVLCEVRRFEDARSCVEHLLFSD